MEQTFYSNGKLLITAEYLILDGAKGLALPTKMGQNLIVNEANSNALYWKSFDNDGSIWYEDSILFEEIKEQNSNTSTDSVKRTLVQILQVADKMNPNLLSKSKGFSIVTKLGFPRNWGLGTSSTLINNIAQWFQIDAFELLHKSFGGSGYDIACAKNNEPITYSISNGQPKVELVSFNPEFSQNLYFVYLNKKRNSKLAIAEYHSNKTKQLVNYIDTINELTENIIATKNFETFNQFLNNHEKILSTILKTETIKNTLFSDFHGAIKSLGAWGGDFVLVASKENPTAYFTSKGYDTILPFKEMIIG